jgi:hypothetical protein
MGPARHQFCTGLVGQVADIVDAVLREHGVEHPATPVRLADGAVFDPEAAPSDMS